jgi:hypothetical protein
MKNDDSDIENFFSELKAIDKFKATPPFGIKEKSKRRWIIPLAAAASIILLIWFGAKQRPEEVPIPKVFVITLEKETNQGIQFTIEEYNELESWESTTTSLLTEF